MRVGLGGGGREAFGGLKVFGRRCGVGKVGLLGATVRSMARSYKGGRHIFWRCHIASDPKEHAKTRRSVSREPARMAA